MSTTKENHADDDDDDSDELPLDLTFTQIDEIRAKHSGLYIKQQNPQLYASICLLLEFGVAKKTIARRCKVSKNAVIAIDRLESPTTVEHHKKVRLDGLRRLSRAAMDMLIEKIESGEDIPAKDLAVILGISIEKEELLSGGATARIERAVDPELLVFYQVLTGQGQGMVLDMEELPPKGAPLALDQDTPGQPTNTITGHKQSPDNKA